MKRHQEIQNDRKQVNLECVWQHVFGSVRYHNKPSEFAREQAPACEENQHHFKGMRRWGDFSGNANVLEINFPSVILSFFE